MTKKFRRHRKDENVPMLNATTLRILEFGYFQDRCNLKLSHWKHLQSDLIDCRATEQRRFQTHVMDL